MTTNVILATFFISLPPFIFDFPTAPSMKNTLPLQQAIQASYP
jgi:hypothetical protein